MLGLPNGDIVTGSTGRKDERDRHVDFKIRFWRKTADGEYMALTVSLDFVASI